MVGTRWSNHHHTPQKKSLREKDGTMLPKWSLLSWSFRIPLMVYDTTKQVIDFFYSEKPVSLKLCKAGSASLPYLKSHVQF
ncbi:hypothetical protein RclHR1_03860006 [Rhizophagus clarus]|uniref:Uncharacterized protein n=1 Tax=Rhizophagus clarus TaxID=94130 RepID=A0A2Z6REP5_9GLOM|nr:hypothetical protein RclHR1_03860006 [Rhizophagus clarus]GES73675.1 hypothetical protein RCL_e16826_RclHR1_03860006 [Rhizophagus clarus]